MGWSFFAIEFLCAKYGRRGIKVGIPVGYWGKSLERTFMGGSNLPRTQELDNRSSHVLYFPLWLKKVNVTVTDDIQSKTDNG